MPVKHPVWEFFDVVKKDGEDFSQCNIVGCKYSVRGKFPTTLHNHVLSVAHKNLHEKYLKLLDAFRDPKKAKKKREEVLKRQQAEISRFTVGNSAKRSKVAPYHQNSPEYRQLKVLLTNFFASSSTPYRLVENLDFRKFVESLNPRFPLPLSHSTVSQWVRTAHQVLCDRIQQAVRDKHLVLISDIWSQKGITTFSRGTFSRRHLAAGHLADDI